MGGNALKHLDVKRISRVELIARMSKLLKLWERLAFSDNPCPFFLIEFPVQLRNKEDAGDLDVIYTCRPEDNEAVIAALKAEFNTRGAKKNGNCTSIEWDDLQVDMIYVPDVDTLEWAANWYSHGDFMALTGRVFRYYRFVLKNNGLYYTINTENQKQEIFLTRDWERALKLLKYKPITRFQTFDESDVYEFVFSSPLAFPGIYTAVKPERPLKRPMQLRFYEWLEDKGTEELLPRSYGWKLLYEFDKKTYFKARLIQATMLLKEVVLPLKRVYKKTWNKTLKPKVYAMLGKDLSKGKRNVRN